MGFKILSPSQLLNNSKEGIPIKELDAEAAKFWDKVVDPKWYASPGNQNNWFDTIGWHIHHNKSSYHYHSGKTTWNMVKESILFSITDLLEPDMDLFTETLRVNRQWAKPYFDLIDHWESEGYLPLRVEN